MGMCLVVLQCARAFENKIAEIARASKNERPGEALLAFFEGGANITGRPARNAAMYRAEQLPATVPYTSSSLVIVGS